VEYSECFLRIQYFSNTVQCTEWYPKLITIVPPFRSIVRHPLCVCVCVTEYDHSGVLHTVEQIYAGVIRGISRLCPQRHLYRCYQVRWYCTATCTTVWRTLHTGTSTLQQINGRSPPLYSSVLQYNIAHCVRVRCTVLY
jgi:hypothetical protein